MSEATNAATTASVAIQAVLTAMAGPDARPRPGQVEAVAALLSGAQRVLVVQATGWGKSAVYWAATLARRDVGAGPTIVISPLLALMRDQVEAARRIGIEAATVNSSNRSDWDLVFERLDGDEIDVLLVSPERLSHPQFSKRAMPVLKSSGLLVIDEAHCISDWGFDFRPDYQRIARLLLELESGTPVLATTATATSRVVDDLSDQLGPSTTVIRGSLARKSLRLAVVPNLTYGQRFAWIHEFLATASGSGIIYGLTVPVVEQLAAFLQEQGHDVEPYTGQTPPDVREQIEARLRANDVKAVVATSALGMGYDKPDLAFCIHVGSPDSPVSYYQQVGRAGRALDSAIGVLLPANESDPDVWEWFATATLPDPEMADNLLALLRQRPHTTADLVNALARSKGKVEVLLKQLQVDGVVGKEGSHWFATGKPWTFDAAKYDRIVELRRAEAGIMSEYASGRECLMQLLTTALDDPAAQPCGRCSVCTGELPSPGARPSVQTVDAVYESLRRRPVRIPPRKLWPSGSGRPGRIEGIAVGRAVTAIAGGVWPDLVEEVLGPDGPLSEQLRTAVVQMLGRWRREDMPAVSAVVPISSAEHPVRVRELADLAAAELNLPVLEMFAQPSTVAEPAQGPARLGQVTARLQLARTHGMGGSVLLVDDISRSKWTLTQAAHMLHDLGVEQVVPLVVATQ
ncbi:MAG: DEAD/DEAH box helicase [Candidatus Nanopelagicales bacterium]|jgi:ATP-dependent DNA helicase RecQ|nr:DEAD/DEAH box helicase [Candidatus Nanopelagicales bacterium]